MSIPFDAEQLARVKDHQAKDAQGLAPSSDHLASTNSSSALTRKVPRSCITRPSIPYSASHLGPAPRSEREPRRHRRDSNDGLYEDLDPSVPDTGRAEQDNVNGSGDRSNGEEEGGDHGDADGSDQDDERLDEEMDDSHRGMAGSYFPADDC